VTLGTCYSVWMTVLVYLSVVPDGHPYRITRTKCRINTVASPDDGHIVARNVQSLINILRINTLRINCALSWLYLQEYTGMHGQQNIQFCYIELRPNL